MTISWIKSHFWQVYHNGDLPKSSPFPPNSSLSIKHPGIFTLPSIWFHAPKSPVLELSGCLSRRFPDHANGQNGKKSEYILELLLFQWDREHPGIRDEWLIRRGQLRGVQPTQAHPEKLDLQSLNLGKAACAKHFSFGLRRLPGQCRGLGHRWSLSALRRQRARTGTAFPGERKPQWGERWAISPTFLVNNSS